MVADPQPHRQAHLRRPEAAGPGRGLALVHRHDADGHRPPLVRPLRRAQAGPHRPGAGRLPPGRGAHGLQHPGRDRSPGGPDPLYLRPLQRPPRQGAEARAGRGPGALRRGHLRP